MHEIFKLQQKIVPDIIKILEKRYNVLKTIYYNQPIGRRNLSSNMNISERIIRNEVMLLKSEGLINIGTSGMTVTLEGEEVIYKLKNFIYDIKGLSDIEKNVEKLLNIKKVIVVPGEIEDNNNVIKELGKTAAIFVKGCIKDGYTIALTGGTTIKELVDSMPNSNYFKDLLIVPARGGMGKDVEVEANTLVSRLAKKLNANYKLLHLPDSLSDKTVSAIMQEKSIRETVESVHNSNMLVYGIGKAEKMAQRRGFYLDEIENLKKKGAVGEAFGCYFNREGKIVFSTPSIGIKNEDVKNKDVLVAVAAGKNKAEAIISTIINNSNSNSILVTDEGAAREIINILKK